MEGLYRYSQEKMNSLIEDIRKDPTSETPLFIFREFFGILCKRKIANSQELFQYLNNAEEASDFTGEKFYRIIMEA